MEHNNFQRKHLKTQIMNSQAARFKEEGNTAYKNAQYAKAIGLYTRAIEADPHDPSFYSNRALCYFNLEKYQECVTDCDQALGLNPTFVKALRKKASALAHLLRFAEATQTIKVALTCEKSNQALKNEVDEYEHYETNYRKYLEASRTN